MAKTIKENGIVYEIVSAYDQNGQISTYAVIVDCDILAMNGDIVRIPGLINGIPVSRIEAAAFISNNWIRYVELPASITYIGEKAFDDCALLKEVRRNKYPLYAKEMAIIERNAFANCPNLQSFIVEGDDDQGHIQIVRQSAFANCPELNKMECHIDYVENRAFSGCSQLKNLSFGNNCYIHPNALDNCGVEKVYFCGTMSDKHLNSVLNQLKKLNIFCTNDFNHLDWAYEGVHINLVLSL